MVMEKKNTAANFRVKHKCGYEWQPRVALPKSCPYCRAYLKEKGKDYQILPAKQKE